MARLDGRVAIVTGAGRGIGRSVAKLLASEGASVVVNDLGAEMDGSGQDAGPAQQVVAEIAEAGGKAVVNGADISDFDAAEDLVKSAIDQFGRLDVLVNVAGILRDRMVFNMTETEWDDVIRVHLKGTFNTTRFASAHWRSLRDETAQNRIINFTSVSGLHGAPGQPNYAAAKMGIVGLTYSSAHSLAKYGVTVNAISPAAATRMTDSIPTERRRVSGRRRRRTLARQRRADRRLPGVGAVRAGSPAGSFTRSDTRSRCTTTPSRSAGSSAPGRGTIPKRSPTRWSGRSGRSWAGTRERGDAAAARPKAVADPDAGNAAVLGRGGGGRAADPALPRLRPGVLLPPSALPVVRLRRRRVVHRQRPGDAVLLRHQPPARARLRGRRARTRSRWYSSRRGPG